MSEAETPLSLFGTARRGRISFHRQADVVFGEGLLSYARAGDVIELRQLAAVVESVFVIEAVEKRRHPPREALNLPDAAQAGGGVRV